MEWDSPTVYVMTVAFRGLFFAILWHYAAYLTKPRIVFDQLEKL